MTLFIIYIISVCLIITFIFLVDESKIYILVGFIPVINTFIILAIIGAFLYSLFPLHKKELLTDIKIIRKKKLQKIRKSKRLFKI